MPAVFGQLIEQGLIDESVMTVSGKTVGECYRGAVIMDEKVIRPFDRPLKERAGFRVLTGNIFHSAVMKMSVISPEFRDRYLSNPDHPNHFEGRAVVFDGPEDYHHRIDDPSLAIDENTLLFMRGAGPEGLSGRGRGGEHARARLPAEEGRSPPRLRRRRPAVGHLRLALDPERLARRRPRAAALALIETGDRVRLDLNQGRLNVLVDDAELAKRRERAGGGRRLPLPGEPDALAGDPARPRRRARDRRGARAGGQVPAHRPDQGHPARQPLTPPGGPTRAAHPPPAGRNPMAENKDFMRHFRIGAWAVAGVILVVLVAVMIS